MSISRQVIFSLIVIVVAAIAVTSQNSNVVAPFPTFLDTSGNAVLTQSGSGSVIFGRAVQVGLSTTGNIPVLTFTGNDGSGHSRIYATKIGSGTALPLLVQADAASLSVDIAATSFTGTVASKSNAAGLSDFGLELASSRGIGWSASTLFGTKNVQISADTSTHILHFANESLNDNGTIYLGGIGHALGGVTTNIVATSSMSASTIQVGTGQTILGGAGAPGGSCTPGSLYLNSSGGMNTSLYVCESSSWVAK